jgi:phospholipid-binding lipoprotein MlaA
MHRAWILRSIVLVLPTLVCACAGVLRDASLPINDPNEETNRKVFAANQAVLIPASQFVKAVTPGPIHDRLHDLNANLSEPRIFVNNILQLRFDAAFKTAGRFIGNSTIGIGGLFDIASQAGLPQQSGDFGQTLFVWGLSEGPYVVRPFWGPSTLRDSVGSSVDLVTNPAGYLLSLEFGMPATIASGSLDATVRLEELKEAEDASIDFYSFLRSSYYQTRRAELRESIGLPSVIESPATPSEQINGHSASTINQSQFKAKSRLQKRPL